MYSFCSNRPLYVAIMLERVHEDQGRVMKRRLSLSVALLFALGAIPLQAGRFIVRVSGGATAIQTVCFLNGCSVVGPIDPSPSQVFLVTTSDSIDPALSLAVLSSTTGVVAVEPDLLAHTTGNKIPAALKDNTPILYYGNAVQHGYIFQPATQKIRLSDLQAAFPKATGAGVVAVLDTGVDTTHPALHAALLPGYDFARNRSGADETLDVSLLSGPIVTGVLPEWVRGHGSGSLDQSTAAVVDQSTAAVVDGNPQYGDFGHGTMVAGIIHLLAPTTKILPVKVFRS